VPGQQLQRYDRTESYRRAWEEYFYTRSRFRGRAITTIPGAGEMPYDDLPYWEFGTPDDTWTADANITDTHLELAPPEAEPDLLLSLEADPLMPEEGLDGLDEDDDEGELLGEDVLELGELDVLLELSPRSHAARPRASATATEIAESFMCPPWGWGASEEAANCAPGLNP